MTPGNSLSRAMQTRELPESYRARYPDIVDSAGEPDLVSVIIPVYNRPEYLRCAIQSVLDQSWPQTEVIVVDDGSTEDIRRVVSEFGGAVVYIHQENSGVAAARNRGMMRSRGEFVAFLDSDDTWHQHKLSAQLAVMRACKGVVLVWTDMSAVSDHGEVLESPYLRTFYKMSFDAMSGMPNQLESIGSLHDVNADSPPAIGGAQVLVGDLFASMFFGNLIHTSTVLFRRQRISAGGGFDTALKHSGEDYDFHWRTCFFGNVALIDTPLVDYRVGGSDQLTAPQWSPDIARNTLRTVNAWIDAFGESGYIRPECRQKRLAFLEFWYGESLILSGQPGGVRSILSSLARDPWRARCWLILILGFLPAGIRIKMLKAWRRRQQSN